MKEPIPFSIFPSTVLDNVSKHFLGIGTAIVKGFPYLEIELKQAEIDYDAKEYGAIIFVLSAFYFLLGCLLFYIIGIKVQPKSALLIAPTMGALFAMLVFVQLTMYPKIKIKRKTRDIEKNLVFSLRTILIQIRSGVSLFDALSLIAEGTYGMVSKEFKRAVDEINTGFSEEEALQKIAMNNPSLFFRRSIWQLVNGMKAGADVSNVLKEMVATMTKEQLTQIKKYGSDLRMLSLIYMMLGVIFPALGLTLLIVLTSFPQINQAINTNSVLTTITPIVKTILPETVPIELLFWGMIVFISIALFMFIGLVKSTRPTLMGGD